MPATPLFPNAIHHSVRNCQDSFVIRTNALIVLTFPDRYSGIVSRFRRYIVISLSAPLLFYLMRRSRFCPYARCSSCRITVDFPTPFSRFPRHPSRSATIKPSHTPDTAVRCASCRVTIYSLTLFFYRFPRYPARKTLSKIEPSHARTPPSTQVRLGSYASDVYMPPSAIVASKAMANDPRAEPKYCERVPYVVVAGPAGARLMDLVRTRLLGRGGGERTTANKQNTAAQHLP